MATDPAFATLTVSVSTAGLGYAPSILGPNTTYYFRTRALNLDGTPTAFTASTAAATLAVPPSGAGIQYFLRARAVNRASVATAYSAVVSTSAGTLSDTTPPSAPGAPVADRQFSYDGTVAFTWSPASSGVGILDYDLLIGSFPGGNDVFNGVVSAPPYTATGLASGRTYYAEVRARSNAGVVGPFSGVSVGVPVYRAAQEPPIAKPFAWPNPFDPARGALQIGFSLNAPASVTFKVYSLQGRLLRETSQSYSAAGNQIGSWDGADGSGRRAAPGGYLIVVEKRYAGGTESQRVKAAVLY
ncbi:MAG: hypothetical protein HY079_02500 [Elusimicrobia bacterium]|nr:hypothetical protein [Elusimicrobiota bacterium]